MKNEIHMSTVVVLQYITSIILMFSADLRTLSICHSILNFYTLYKLCLNFMKIYHFVCWIVIGMQCSATTGKCLWNTTK